MGRVRAYVGLGANVGRTVDTLAAAVHALAALPGARLAGVSRLYATVPVGLTDQPEFHNAAVALDVPGGPDPASGALALLVAFKALERAFGRGGGPRWGPRELDLDLLVFGRHAIRVERPPVARTDDPDRAGAQWLVVPHASARERLFVLAPLADLAPGLRPPGWGETVATARARAQLLEVPDAVRPVAAWDRVAGAWKPGGPDVAPDGSPVAVYRALPGDADAALIHGTLVDLGLGPDCEILELGSGAGRVTGPLAALGHHVVAVDQSGSMLHEVRRRVPSAEAVPGDIETLDLGRRVTAVVLGSHLVNAEPRLAGAFLATCRRHVAAGGAVLIQSYDPDRDWTASVGRAADAGSVTITLLRADRTGNQLAGSVAYETGEGRWVQDFDASLLDEPALRALLASAGLRFDRWVDRPAGWLVARPA